LAGLPDKEANGLTDAVPTPEEMLAMYRADRGNAQLALYAGAALDDAGRRDEAVAVWSLGDDADPALRRVKDNGAVHPLMREHSARADMAMREFFTNLHARAMDDFVGSTGAEIGRVRDAIWSLTHDRPFKYETPDQKPTVFYMPGLPAAPVFDNTQIPWVSALESAFGDIKAEYEAAASDESAMTPYVPANTPSRDWAKLRGTLDWSVIYRFKDSRSTDHIRKFPKTLAALEKTDLVRIGGVPMEVFFSRLTPGAHIPPHFGLTNTRLTVHLPLIIPETCAIRVGKDECVWRPGEIIAFDDSFEHEAWNRSDSDRVVLIFEAHHPDLSGAERQAIEYAYAVRRHWLNARTVLLGWHHWDIEAPTPPSSW